MVHTILIQPSDVEAGFSEGNMETSTKHALNYFLFHRSKLGLYFISSIAN
jgi:hypothetical protein